jgi:hypothetical protein
LKLDFDSDSSDLWLMSTEESKLQQHGGKHTLFDPTKSDTAKKLEGQTWKITYGDGSGASGDVWTDVVRIGSIEIAEQTIELAQKISAQFQQDENSGLFGLAWPSLNTVRKRSRAAPANAPMQNMIEKGLIALPVFTVKLTHGDSPGFYTFGSIDETVTSSPIEYTKVDNSQGFWSFDSESYTINGETFNIPNGKAIMDTGQYLFPCRPFLVSTK